MLVLKQHRKRERLVTKTRWTQETGGLQKSRIGNVDFSERRKDLLTNKEKNTHGKTLSAPGDNSALGQLCKSQPALSQPLTAPLLHQVNSTPHEHYTRSTLRQVNSAPGQLCAGLTMLDQLYTKSTVHQVNCTPGQIYTG